MKQIYWRPRGLSRTALLLIAILSLAGLASVEVFQVKVRQPLYREKILASRLALRAFETIKTERLRRRIKIDKEVDLSESGVLGELMSPVTSNAGSLSAKITSINPNFAGVMVHYFNKAECQEGDVVAVGFSGSFPAMNICVCAAMETLKLKPIIISSNAASQWGANHTRMLWIDMESILHKKNVFTFRSHAASIGGIEDRGLGMSKDGVRRIRYAIERSKVPMIDPVDYAESIEKRMEIYREYAGEQPIKAYINVGGGTTSVGTKVGKRLFRPGLNRTAPQRTPEIDSMMLRFSEQGIPVIHLVHIERLAKRYGLTIKPVRMPPLGEGKIFIRLEYNPWLTVSVLVGILICLYVFIRSDWGFRILISSRRRKDASHPEPMV